MRNPSMMVQKPGWVLRLLGRFFFSKVTFAEDQKQKLRDLEEEGPLVYVLPSQSLLDYLYFNWAFVTHALPVAMFGKGMRMWPFRTIGAQVRSALRWMFRRRKPKADDEIIRNATAQGRSVVVFLRRARSLLPGWGDFETDPLRAVIETHRSTGQTVHLVPILIVWERAPGAFRRGVFDTVFGDPDAPGRLRKVLNFLGNHRQALVQVGEPIEVGAFVEEHAHLDRLEALGQKVRWALNQGFRVERKVIKGPVLKNAAQIREEIMRLEPFHRRLQELADAQGRTLEDVKVEADQYLEEIVADWKLSYIEFFCIILTFVFGRLYAGIEINGLPAVREAAKRAPLVIMPSHKSHLDYLLVSYVFYANGLVPPHIAAGKNLSFWPMGHLFRRTGAFFLRRSFGQNPVYSETFRTYVHKLVKTGYSVEFFLEGGRSRTGKLLPPRYGLLRHVVESIVMGQAHDVSMVPAAICYQKIVEAEAYARELSGARKEKENLGQLVGATRVLAERFGRVYLNFPEPFSLREFLIAQGVDLEAGFIDDEHRRHVVKALAYRVLGDINRGAVVTASAVVAMALLSHPRRGMSRETLLRTVGAIVDYLLATGASLASSLQTALAANRAVLEKHRDESNPRARTLAGFDGEGPRAEAFGRALSPVVDEALSLFVEKKHIAQHEYPDRKPIYQVPAERRLELEYYKNNLVHAFVRESLLASGLLRCVRADDMWGDRLRNETEFVSRLLKAEYVFDRSDDFDAQYRDTLAVFEEAGLLEADRAARIQVARRALPLLRRLAGVTLPVLEGYSIVAEGLCRLEQPVELDAFLRDMQTAGERAWREGHLNHREAVNSVTYANALRRYQEDAFVVAESRPTGRKGRPVRWIRQGEGWDAVALRALVDRIRLFLRPQSGTSE